MKPEYIGVGNFDEDHYVYAVCDCPVTEGWAIKFNKILDGKPHRYSCVCENCGTKVVVYTKSYEKEIGHWIIMGNRYIKCSECGHITKTESPDIYNFCMVCGKRMIEPQESEVQE